MDMQLIIAKEITYEFNTSSHSIINVINELDVEVIPCIIEIAILIKILLDAEEQIQNFSIQILNEAGESVLTTEDIEAKNIRNKGMKPGIDIATNARFLVKSEGDYWVNLVIENKVQRSYPIKLNDLEDSI